jgi:photosystem II stability/assembly factor-like uncharacterized protein
VWFTDAVRGFIIGDGGTALRTVDGGVTWSRMPVRTAVNLHDVRFLNANVGFIVGELGTVLLSTDGGLTWQSETPTPSRRYIPSQPLRIGLTRG